MLTLIYYSLISELCLLLIFFSRYNIQAVFKVSETNGWDIRHLASSEVRIIILYCTQSEASLILEAADKSGLTSHKYLWLVTQSVIGDPGQKSHYWRAWPLGMLGRQYFFFLFFGNACKKRNIHKCVCVGR